MSYVTLDEFKAYIRNEIPAADDTDLLEAQGTAYSSINDMCGRVFTVASTASARTYAPNPSARDVLRIHDATTITAVVENGTALVAATGYQAEPVQTVTWAGEVRPYEKIRRLGGTGWYTLNGSGTVAVTATWGWSAIPAAVKVAEKILAKDIALYRDVKFGLVGVSDFGGIRARQAALVGEILKSYMHADAGPGSHSDLVRSDWADAAQFPTHWDSRVVDSWT